MKKTIYFVVLLSLIIVFLSGCDFLLDYIFYPEEDYPASPSEDDDSNTLLGYPSEATLGHTMLIEHDAYTLLYSLDDLRPVWVSWHLDADDSGDIPREDNFKPDPELKGTEYEVDKDDFTNSEFDRGHLCPNADRNGNKQLQDETFYMTNMAMQNHSLNNGEWKSVEEYLREIVETKDMEAYIIAGVYGEGGINDLGELVYDYDNPKDNEDVVIAVPSDFWKVAILIEDGNGDFDRIDDDVKVLAVDLPNGPLENEEDWRDYLTSIDKIEKDTGLDFFALLPDDIENNLEKQISNPPAV